jgi:hypothetical protein
MRKGPTMTVDASALPAQLEEERRAFRRLAVGVRVRYQEVRLRRPEREYLKAVAEDVSLGGMFLSPRHMFPEGTAIEVEFRPCDEAGGLGVRFVEFVSLGERRLESWIETVLAPESIGA